MGSKLAQLRSGKPTHKFVTIRGMKAAVVLLSSDLTRQINEDTAEYCSQNSSRVDEQVRQNYFDQLLAFHALRDPDNLSEKLADSLEELSSTLDIEDISRITAAYGDMLINKAPKIELLTEEQLDELKKYLGVTPLSDLSTVSLVHLANFHQTIHS